MSLHSHAVAQQWLMRYWNNQHAVQSGSAEKQLPSCAWVSQRAELLCELLAAALTMIANTCGTAEQNSHCTVSLSRYSKRATRRTVQSAQYQFTQSQPRYRSNSSWCCYPCTEHRIAKAAQQKQHSKLPPAVDMRTRIQKTEKPKFKLYRLQQLRALALGMSL